MQFYSVYRDTCMYKNFCKNNQKQYIEIKGGFLYGTIYKIQEIFYCSRMQKLEIQHLQKI